VQAIDVHGHFGPYNRGMRALTDRMMAGGIEVVSERAQACDIRLTVVSSIRALIPYRGDVTRGNEDAVAAAEQQDDIRFWAVIDPLRTESYAQADELLAHPRCKGIKIHPHAHAYEILQHGEAIFAFAAERSAVMLTHSGDPGSYPEHFLPFIDRYPQVQLILAHLGNSDDGGVARQVDAIKAARNGNVWVDTSSSRSMFSDLIEWAVDELGHDRILFGTDTPLYWSATQKSRIESASISEEAKAAILYKNAAALLNEDVSSNP
jgi:predicted TIM-barrel fold metal-dependent hydrolase